MVLNRNFSLLFVAQIVSQIGDSMYQIALLWVVLDITGSNSMMGLAGTIAHLPILLFGLLGGALADLYDRKRIMILSDALRMLTVLVLPVSYIFADLNVSIILTVSFLLSAFVESSLGFGMLLGAILLNLHPKYLPKGKLLLLAMIFDGATHVVYFCHDLELLMLLIAFHAIGIPYIVVMRTSLIQEWVDDRNLGRVFSIVNMAVIGVTALTTGLTGWLADLVAIDAIFAVFGSVGMLCGFVGWLFKPLRNA